MRWLWVSPETRLLDVDVERAAMQAAPPVEMTHLTVRLCVIPRWRESL